MKRTALNTLSAAATVAILTLAWNARSPLSGSSAATPPNDTVPGAETSRAAPNPASNIGEDPRTVLILYRTNCPDFNKNGVGDSEEVARYYAERRGVPRENLLGVKVTGASQDVFDKYATWPYEDFQAQVIQPLRKKLTELGLYKILYIVSTFGMPIRLKVPGSEKAVSADAALSNPMLVRNDGLHMWRFYDAPQNTTHYDAPRFATARAEWDGSDAPDKTTYLVSRLDGMGVVNAKALVDGALYAEKYKVDGFAYVDTRFGAYTDTDLDAWEKAPYYQTTGVVDKGIAVTRRWFAQAGVKVRQQPDDGVIGSSPKLTFTDGSSAVAAPRAVAYAGWYNYGAYTNVFDWLPGSVAMDFDSVSLFAPRQLMGSFGGMALLYGASGAVGCFDEPYTSGHPRPDVLFYYYMRGYNFAEASWLSMPYQPYVNYAIGDPLMRPYGHPREDDTRLEKPVITWKRDGDEIRADIQMTGNVEIARARLLVVQKNDDSLLDAPGRSDGAFRRDFSLTARIPNDGPAFAGIVLIDPAGHTLRVWKDLRAGD